MNIIIRINNLADVAIIITVVVVGVANIIISINNFADDAIIIIIIIITLY